MNKEEMQKEVTEIRKGMRFFDEILGYDYDKAGKDDEKIKHYITGKQANIVGKTLDLLKSLNWQLALDNTKKLVIDEDDVIREHYRSGSPVKISPCGDEYGGKTYFGILIGDVALSISQQINKDDPNTLHIKNSMYNPAIFIPELKKVVYGCESWWGEIKSEEDLKKVITEDTIDNVWYVKMLTALNMGCK